MKSRTLLPLMLLMFATLCVHAQAPAPTFASPVSYTVGPGSVPIAKGDFTGDGKIDIAVGNMSNKSVSIMRNSGTGTFVLHSNVAFTGATAIPYDIVAADFDLDGDVDIAAILIGSLGILTNNGTGTFTAAVVPSIGTSQMSLAVGQFGGDTKPDLAVANPNGAAGQKLISLRNTSTTTISFSAPTYHNSGNFVNDVEIVDVNNDSKTDLLSTNTSSNSVSVLFGDGAGNFGTNTNYATGDMQNPVDMTVADFNGDSFKDLMVTQGGFSFARIMLNNGAGGFPTATAFTVDPSGNEVGVAVISDDFNGDGKADVAFRGSSSLFVYPGDGAGGFGPLVQVAGGGTPGSQYNFLSSDLNADSRPDFAVISQETSSSLLWIHLNTTIFTQEPTVAASNVTFANITTTAARIQWTSGNGSNRLVVMKAATAVNQSPVDLTAYTANASFPSGQEIVTGSGNRVVYGGTGAFVDVTGLTAGTTYHVAVYEFNGTGSATNYRITGAPVGNFITTAPEPTTSTTAVTFSNIASTTVRVQWTNGNGAGRLVVARQGAAVNQLPVDRLAYTANANFPQGQEIVAGTGNRAVFASTGNFVDITGLTAGTVYHFTVYEYNGTGASRNYKTTTPPSGNVTTRAVEPTTSATALTVTNITATAMRVQWTNGNGAGRIVVARQAAAVNQVPTDGTAYTANANFPSGQEVVAGTGNRVVYASTGNFVDVTGLTPATAYHFAVYEYNGSGASLNYRTTTPAIGSGTTLPNIYVVNPANGTVANNITLTVNGLAGAASYTIEVNTNATFTGTKVEKTSSELSINFPELTFNTNYWVRVKTNLSSTWGPVTTFSTGASHTFAYLTTPANGAIATSNSLTSNVVPTATQYTIEVSTSSTFPVGSGITKVGSRTLSFPELAYNQLYYARVKTNLSATWGPTQTFTTGTVDNFTYITSPANGGVTSTYSVSANNITGATLYTIEINTSSSFALATAITKQSSTRTMQFPEMVYNQLYYARVKTNLSPNWGPTRTFTTSPVEQFTYIITPTNGSIDVPVDVQLIPNKINGTTDYSVTVSENADYSIPFFDQSGTGTPYSPWVYGLNYGTLYYVRVKTSLSANWGPTRSFTTLVDPSGRKRTYGSKNLETNDRAYPNAIVDHVNFFVQSKTEEAAAVTITDSQGHAVYESLGYTFSTNREHNIGNLQSLPRGIYFVTVSFRDERRVFRLVKAN